MDWQPYLLAAAGSLTLITSNQTAEITAQQEIQQVQDSPVEVVEAAPAAYPNRIEINVNITAHEDLKIAQDMMIAKGQVISDRIPERTRLQAQEKQLQLSLLSIRTASIAPPPKPQPVPAVAPLPPVNYLEQNAAIAKAKIAIANSLSLSQIRELIKELKPVQQQEQLKTRFDTTYKQVKKSQQLWQDPKKRKKLESLLSQLEKLIESESPSVVNKASLNAIFEEPESPS